MVYNTIPGVIGFVHRSEFQTAENCYVSETAPASFLRIQENLQSSKLSDSDSHYCSLYSVKVYIPGST
jgi:hypothetical protein